MNIWSNSFKDGERLCDEFAFATYDPATGISFAANLNPHIGWSNAPASTRSFALVCHDPDVPWRGDDVNQPGRLLPAEMLRVDFYHWVLFDIPASVAEIAAGSQSNCVTLRGKPGPAAANGLRHSLNDYTQWLNSDAEMSGQYYGYDGPCPPWNDCKVHRYVFTVYALDVTRLDSATDNKGATAARAIQKHALASASMTGTYSLNPTLREAP